MKKKNILLTIWLALPITIVSLLMVWIFSAFNSERLMDDAVPVGAGAGDTGNANAIGEWLAGHNADAISKAVKARREGLAMDPRDWPGGVVIKIPVSAFDTQLSSKMLLVINEQDSLLESMAMNTDGHDGYAVIQLTQEQVLRSLIYAGAGSNILIINGRFTDGTDRTLKPILFEPQIPDPNLQTSEPMVVEVRMESVYEESP